MAKIESTVRSEAPARMVAAVVAAKGYIDGRELQRLGQLDAWRRLGMPHERFVALVHEAIEELGSAVGELSWLRTEHRMYLDRLIEAVEPRETRLLVCRLAAAVITADGCVSPDERLVYDHVRARWHLTHDMVTQAILHDAAA